MQKKVPIIHRSVSLLLPAISVSGPSDMNCFCFCRKLSSRKEEPRNAASENQESIKNKEDTVDDWMIALILAEEYARADGSACRLIGKTPLVYHNKVTEGCGALAVKQEMMQPTASVKDRPALAMITDAEKKNMISPAKHVQRMHYYTPIMSDASMDYQRLHHRLHAYRVYEVKVSGDGNCQFRALSQQLYGSPKHHRHVRRQVMKELRDHCSLYEPYVSVRFNKYTKTMASNGEWGDHITLQAAAEKFEAKICLLTSYRDTGFLQIMPLNQEPKHELWLSFCSVHFNSLHKIGDDAQVQTRKKHGSFRI